MIYEERDYHVHPGKLARFVALYRDHGLDIQKKYLGTFYAYFTTEIGELNHVVALWSYTSLDDRAQRRAAMMADPAWQDYLAKVDGLLERQTTRVLTPVDFSPMQ
ncbi:NIPSNAP family protein [Acuticoccus mangrovi]|uniref:NIPSNAP family protein n=1 Tax=Acuticoccus mangrovi TaxID=2796142 RepID=A0A934IPC2_9HYPH|nr:NIPSNAP family protein [Acuticoccus mangrovi]MBJ3775852.1 NIPSNAP family protein [Acuticoccus mangrovi]